VPSHIGRTLWFYLHTYEHGIQTFYRGGPTLRIQTLYLQPCLAYALVEVVEFLLYLNSTFSLGTHLFLVFTTNNGLEDFFRSIFAEYFSEFSILRVREQRSR
jgi:hypothetical protein